MSFNIPRGTGLKFVINTGWADLITDPSSEDQVSPHAAANVPRKEYNNIYLFIWKL